MHSNRIRELREDKDIIQQEIAEYLCVAQNTYSNYENGRREIQILRSAQDGGISSLAIPSEAKDLY